MYEHNQLPLEEQKNPDLPDLLTVEQACSWASKITARKIAKSNIMYLLQYGRIAKQGTNPVLIGKEDLQKYYLSHYGSKEDDWKKSWVRISTY